MPDRQRLVGVLASVACLLPAAHAVAVEPSARADATVDVREVDWRPGYSSIVFGASLIDYEERTRIELDGRAVDVDTDLRAIVTQSSNAFVAVDRRWGFYLHTLATLGTSRSSERWQVGGTTVRHNKIAFERQALGLLGARRIGASSQFLFGVRYGNAEFKRFAAQLRPEAAELGITDETFANGTVSETAWDISVQVGYERGTLFGRDTRGWQYRWQVTVGSPLITSFTDTEIDGGDAFYERFNGYEARLYGLIGYRLGPHFLIGANVQTIVQKRQGVDGRSFGEETLTAFPPSRTVTVIPSLGAYWSF